MYSLYAVINDVQMLVQQFVLEADGAARGQALATQHGYTHVLKDSGNNVVGTYNP